MSCLKRIDGRLKWKCKLDRNNKFIVKRVSAEKKDIVCRVFSDKQSSITIR